MQEKISLFLPVPVTINQAYKNAGKKRTLTANTRRWKQEAMWALHNRGFAKQYAAEINRNKKIRDSCIARIGSALKVSIYELRKKFTQEYVINYRFWFGDDQLRDVANFEKVLTDFLCENGLLVDDQFICEMHMYRMGIDRINPRVEIEIISLDGVVHPG